MGIDFEKEFSKVIIYYDKKLTLGYLREEILQYKALTYLKKIDPKAIGWEGCQKEFFEGKYTKEGYPYCASKNECIYKNNEKIARKYCGPNITKGDCRR